MNTIALPTWDSRCCWDVTDGGDFVNLDFEHPDLSHATPNHVIPGYLKHDQ